MRTRGRYDAALVKLPANLNAFFPYLMKGRNDSIAYFPFTIEVDKLLEYIEESKGTDHELTFFQACLIATVKVLRTRPSLNRYVIGRRMYQRKDVILSFLARKEFQDDSTEVNVMLTVKENEEPTSVVPKLSKEVRAAKSGEERADNKLMGLLLKLPRFMLQFFVKLVELWDFYVDTPKFIRGVDPMRCSVFIANVGSVGLGAPYHHLFEWGTCSIFLTIGKIHKKVLVGDDDQPVVRQVVDLKFALDERIADGYYDARSLELFTKYFSEPSLLWDNER